MSLGLMLVMGLVLMIGAPIALMVVAWLAYVLILVASRMAALLPRLLTGTNNI